MKLATRKNGSRDGELMVVSRDLSRWVTAHSIAVTLQQALDDWEAHAPELQNLSDALNSKQCSNAQPFIAHQCHAPLPRAYQWADGSAYLNHVELVRQARGAEMPASFRSDPLMYQGGSDRFLGPTDPIACLDESHGIDFEGEIAVITGDVPMHASLEQAEQAIRLVMLVNDVSLRSLIPSELAKGFGFFHSKPSSTFSPVAVTLDELGEFWRGNKLHLPLLTTYNGELFGCPNAGADMNFDFTDLIVHASKTRALSSGCIIGSGTVSNRQGTGRCSSIANGGVGYSCIAELRMIETIRSGEASTGFMQFGDSVQMEVRLPTGENVFGTIDQQVCQYGHH